MLSWCAYCQQFQGELPPFESMKISHGMCSDCAGKDFDTAEHHIEHAHELRGIQRKLKLAGERADRGEIADIVDAAVAAGVRPVDILLGLTAPLLYGTGKAWEAATFTVSDEHRFTAFCENTFAIIEARVRAEMPDAFAHEDIPHADIVVLNAPGNRHTFGIRVLTLWLIARGHRARIILPQPDLTELVERVVAAAPQVVAISVALAEQRAGAEALVAQLVACGLSAQLFIGGNAVKLGMCQDIAGAVLCADAASLTSWASKPSG